MKNKIKYRLILSIFMLGLTAVTLTTSTFAWFATNRNAWFDEVELEIGNTDSILVSVDGTTYSSSIPSDMVKKAVVAKKKNLDFNSEQLKDETFVNNEWKKVSLEPITTNNLVNYQCVDNKHIAHYKDNLGNDLEDTYYVLHDVDETNSYAYIEFDVWFKMDSSKSSTKTYDLKLVNDAYITEEANLGHTVKSSYIKGEDTEIELYNNLTTQDGTKHTGDKITVNTKDAMRVGFTILEQKGAQDNKKFIFEPYEGLGSYALNSCINTQDTNKTKYDPNKNAMWTYFNNINEPALEALDDTAFDYINSTYKNNLQDDISIAEIIPNQTETAYTTVKMTISVWLEGFDADYIIGMKNNSLKMYLNFFAKERE